MTEKTEVLGIPFPDAEFAWVQETATTSLRFVSRDGSPVLQQRWVVRTSSQTEDTEVHEWRDVQSVGEE